MIKMIAGVYGHRINGRVEAKTTKSDPFSVDAKTEARLVNAGLAVYVEATEKVVTKTENIEKSAKNIDELSYNDLRAKASNMGLIVDGNKKQDYIDAIKTALNPAENTDGVSAPTFNTADTVVD